MFSRLSSVASTITSSLSHAAEGLPAVAVAASNHRPFSTVPVAIQGANGGQGQAMTQAAIQNSRAKNFTVFPVVRKLEPYLKGTTCIKEENKPDTIVPRTHPNVNNISKAADAPPGTIFVNAVVAGGVKDTVNDLPADARVLMTQNGVDLGEGNRKDKQIAYGISTITSVTDGQDITVTAGGVLKVGADTPFLKELETYFSKQPIFDLVVVSNIQDAKWEKIALNTALNSVATLLGVKLGDLLDLMKKDSRCEKLVFGLIQETRLVALAENVKVKDQVAVQNVIVTTMEKFPQHPTSMQTAFKSGQKLEVDVISGGISAIGKRHQVPTPLNDLVTDHINRYVALRDAQKNGTDAASDQGKHFHAENETLVAQTRETLFSVAETLY